MTTLSRRLIALATFLSLVGCSGSSSTPGGAGGGGGGSGAGGGGGGAGGGGAQAVDGGDDGTPDAAVDPCAPGGGAVMADVVSIAVTNTAGEAPKKGDALRLTLMIDNSGDGVGTATITPRVESHRFSDYVDVPLGSAEVTLCRGATEVTVEGGPFLDDAATNKHFALGSGDYSISAVDVEVDAQGALTDHDYEGKDFAIATSNAVLVPVVYDVDYLPSIDDNDAATVEEFLVESFTRPNQIFTPSTDDPDGPGTYQSFEGGFDQMMNVRQIFHGYPGFPGESTTDEGWCEDAAAYAKTALGMAGDWTGSGTLAQRHGFDYLIALTPDMGGGVTCGWLDVQVSSLINHDRDRQQIVAVHETGHIFGSPHCDDVGNGDGGSLQGYVMCSGEKHANYPEYFVWHSTSIAHMSPHWD
jgi:hypothetical protein